MQLPKGQQADSNVSIQARGYSHTDPNISEICQIGSFVQPSESCSWIHLKLNDGYNFTFDWFFFDPVFRSWSIWSKIFRTLSQVSNKILESCSAVRSLASFSSQKSCRSKKNLTVRQKQKCREDDASRFLQLPSPNSPILPTRQLRQLVNHYRINTHTSTPAHSIQNFILKV